MLDGLLGRGFVPKGKSLIKLTKHRIDVLRRKRTATIKFLKKDLADLLANGLDVNAYGRAGGLLDELKHLWNLDFVDKCCDFVYKHLSTMQKIRECPEDCREAVSSLMFAASAFSELPELRDLRQMFHEKYGDSLELFVSQELVESLSMKPISLEKKGKLMEDVASEFSIPWDLKAFEQRLLSHNTASAKELNKNHGPPKATGDKYKSIDENNAASKREKNGISSKERAEGFNNNDSLNRNKDDASKGTDPFSQHTKESFRNGCRGEQYRIPSRERSQNVHHLVKSESKNDEAERNVFGLQSMLEPSGGRHKPLFNDGDTIVMKVKRENLLQRNGHENGMEHELKKTKDIASSAPKPSSLPERDEKLSFAFKQENFFQGHKQVNCAEHVNQKSEDSVLRSQNPSSSFSKRKEIMDHGSRHCNDWENKGNALPAGEESLAGSRNGRLEIATVTHNSKSRDRDPFGGNNQGAECDNAKPIKVQEEETERPKPFFHNALPPPYVKPNGTRNRKSEAVAHSKAAFDSNSVQEGTFNNRLETAEVGSHPDVDGNVFVPERANGRSNGKDSGLPVDTEENALPKKSSSRRRHSKSSSREEIVNPEDPGIMKRRTRSRRREHSKKISEALFDNKHEKDDEERMIDKLLMHYSQKPSSYDEMRTKQESKGVRRTRHNKEGEHGGSSDMSEMIPPPARSLSLPNEQSESTKVFTRAASFQPDRSSAAKHVHPKLPDYEDLAARFAALKGS